MPKKSPEIPVLKPVLIAASLLLSSCASLTDAGAKVRVVSEQDRKACAYLKLVTIRVSLGPDKPGQALKKAFNETAEAGGDSLFVINNSQDVFDGAAIAGEALRCSK
jgi:hypothetical protein